jgi:hypothetical protein
VETLLALNLELQFEAATTCGPNVGEVNERKQLEIIPKELLRMAPKELIESIGNDKIANPKGVKVKKRFTSE